MKIIRLALLICTAFALASCGKSTPVPPPSGSVVEADDLKLIAGKWGVVKVDVLGEEPPKPGEFEVLVIEVKGSLVTASEEGHSSYATIKLDPTKSPKEIDATQADKDGNPKGDNVSPAIAGNQSAKKPAETVKGIYKFEGDNLVIAFSPPNQPRPTEFKPVAEEKGKPDNGVFVMTFKKIGDDEAAKRNDTIRRPPPTTSATIRK